MQALEHENNIAQPKTDKYLTPQIKNTKKTNNQAIKGLNADQNLRAQKLPPPVCERKYALLHALYRNVHDYPTSLDIHLNEN